METGQIQMISKAPQYEYLLSLFLAILHDSVFSHNLKSENLWHVLKQLEVMHDLGLQA